MEYSVCSDANSFSLTDEGAGIAAGAAANTKFALQDTSCTNDFIEISGESPKIVTVLGIQTLFPSFL